MCEDVAWDIVWQNIRMPVLSFTAKSFAWKLAHDLLPTEERLGKSLQNHRKVCKFSCPHEPIANLEHCFFHCSLTREVGTWVLEVCQTFDANACPKNVLKLTTTDNCLSYLVITALHYCWLQRAKGKKASIEDFKASIKVDLQVLLETRHRAFSEEASQLISAVSFETDLYRSPR